MDKWEQDVGGLVDVVRRTAARACSVMAQDGVPEGAGGLPEAQ